MLIRARWWFIQRRKYFLMIAVFCGLFLFTGHRSKGILTMNVQYQHAVVADNTWSHDSNRQPAPTPTIVPNIATPAAVSNFSNTLVLLTSYMRSGSSFLGELLGFQDDAFYWYEPIWNLHAHYIGSDVICPGNDSCRPVKQGDTPVKVVLDMFSQFFTCNLAEIAAGVSYKFTDSYSGPKWSTYTSCRRWNSPDRKCLGNLSSACASSKHLVAKLIRLTLDNTQKLLEQNKNLKVVHLFRDPRAIINSRIKTSWHILKETPKDGHAAIKADAKELCDRMKLDLADGIALKRRFPDRFAFIYFEDLVDNLEDKLKLLYAFLDMNPKVAPEVIKKLQSKGKHTKKASSTKKGGFSDWWRMRMMMDVVAAIDSVCFDVYESLGYIQVTNKTVLKNLQQKTFKLPSSAILQNVDKHLVYDFGG